MTSQRSVVLAVGEADRLGQAAAAVGLHLTEVPGAGRAVSRPAVTVNGAEVAACLLSCTGDGQPLEVWVIAGPAGFVAVAPDSVLAGVRRIAETAPDPLLAFVEVLVLLAREWEEAMEDLVDVAAELSGSLGGLRSAEPRGRIAQLRARLLASQHRMTAQAWLLESDGELSGALPSTAQRSVVHARSTFHAAGSTAMQTYQLLGDVLVLQATTISERLTLTSILFLPLTVITGFFGMNFGWLVDSVSTSAAFWLLGVVLPTAVVLAILRLFRRLGVADEKQPTG